MVAKSEATELLFPFSCSAIGKRDHEEEHIEVTDELSFVHSVGELISKVDELERKVNEVSEFYATKRQNDIKGNLDLKERQKQGINSNNNNVHNNCNNSGTKKVVDRSSPQIFGSKRMQKLMGQFGTVLRQENGQKEDEAHALANMHVTREAAIGKMALDTDNELNELNLQLEELREMVVRKCRKWTTEEKRKLGAGLSTLSIENLNKALEIIAESNPSFQAFGEVVEFDMDAQSEATLWRLKVFVKETLKIQRKSDIGGGSARNLKRKKETFDVPSKTDNKRRKKNRLSHK